MIVDKNHIAMTNAVITAAEHVNRSGSPELQAVMRVLLYVLGRELADQASKRSHPGEAFTRIIGRQRD